MGVGSMGPPGIIVAPDGADGPDPVWLVGLVDEHVARTPAVNRTANTSSNSPGFVFTFILVSLRWCRIGASGDDVPCVIEREVPTVRATNTKPESAEQLGLHPNTNVTGLHHRQDR